MRVGADITSTPDGPPITPSQAGAVGGCKEPTVEAYLDADETCVCGEEPWVQLPSGAWYNEADLQECNLNGDGATGKGEQSSPH